MPFKEKNRLEEYSEEINAANGLAKKMMLVQLATEKYNKPEPMNIGAVFEISGVISIFVVYGICTI